MEKTEIGGWDWSGLLGLGISGRPYYGVVQFKKVDDMIRSLKNNGQGTSEQRRCGRGARAVMVMVMVKELEGSRLKQHQSTSSQGMSGWAGRGC